MSIDARILAVTAAGKPLPRALARVIGALRSAGAEVVPLSVPDTPPKAPRADSVPSLSDLKRGLSTLVEDLVTRLGGEDKESADAHEHWLAGELRKLDSGPFNAVIAVDPEVAGPVFAAVADVWPDAVRVGVDGDYHIDPEWAKAEFDDLVVPHPALGQELGRVRSGQGRIRAGGPVVGGDEITAKRIDEERPQVIVSFARLEPGDVDQLLFQLSLTRPDRFDLLFLASGRAGVDELIRTRAQNYGLSGKRTKPGADPEPWLKGAALLIGHPSPAESAAAVAARVPQLIYTPSEAPGGGDAFLIRHGLALHSDIPITIAVHTEGLLPGGPDRVRADAAFAEFDISDADAAASAILGAARAGRPRPGASAGQTASDAAPLDDDLEDIGAPTAARDLQDTPTDLHPRLRRAYLKEIILQENALRKQLGKAHGGLDLWQRRVRLARTAGDDGLADKAVPRVEGLRRIVDKLNAQLAELAVLHERFASRAPVTEADRVAAGRLMSPATAASLDRGQAPDSAFAKLEIDAALKSLKDKISGR